MDELNETFMAAEGAAGAEQAGKAAGNKQCLNCGAELKGVYCYVCGQKDLPKRQTTLELLANFVSSFSNYEGKFLLTAKYLILRPGSLALEYNAGHRERYFHPVRMYAFISFVFFLIFFSLPDTPDKKDDVVEMTDEDRKELAKDSVEKKEVFNKMAALGVDTTTVNFDSLAAYDSAQNLLTEDKRDGWFEATMTRRSIELHRRLKDEESGFGKELWKATLENFPKMLFFLLPVFALLLKFLYLRRNYFYSEHLVFSIYFYNFFYFAGSLMMLAGLSEATGWVGTVIAWGIYIYLLFAMKRMYGQGWGKTIAKFLLFSFSFMICFFIGLAINLFVIVMII